MNQSEAKQNIEAVYAGYMEKLNNLKKEQSRVIAEFIAELEKAKIEEVKRNLHVN